ncbi:hypothetical protein FOA52_014370 [Chlamydomonas sp. UWO 241]|nr:hypothetical protein FOA52_014370 [Chlamydomonas sp. UWO 241]
MEPCVPAHRVALWLDCDPGHDDAMAIILAGHDPRLELLGISTVAGNQTVEKVTQNALDVLAAAGLHGIGVVAGLAKPLLRPSPILCPEIHGDSGLDCLSGLPLLPCCSDEPRGGKAPVVMFAAIEAAWVRGGRSARVALVAIGALSNVALLLMLYPEVVPMIDIVIMGGCLGLGNTGPVVEFNIQTDPEAAKAVFECPGVSLTMVGLEVTHTVLATPSVIMAIGGDPGARARVVGGDGASYAADAVPSATTRGAGALPRAAELLRQADADAAADAATPFRAFVGRLLMFFADTYRKVFEFAHPPVHDPAAVAYVIAPQLFRTQEMRVDVETCSGLSSGQTVADRWGQSGKAPNVRVCLSVDVPGFWGLMLDAVERADGASPLNKAEGGGQCPLRSAPLRARVSSGSKQHTIFMRSAAVLGASPRATLPSVHGGNSHAKRGVAAGASSSASQMSKQMKEMRASIDDVEDERLRVLMAGLRGSNMNADDFASATTTMNLVEMGDMAGDTDSLPQSYEPNAIAAYWGRRPVSIIMRILQLLGIGSGFLSKLAWDASTGRLKETEVARAIDLRNIVTSLGPAYIKLGQALSIRPDLLSPAAMNEMQKLCDKVPSFDSKIAMQVLQDELGMPWHEAYAELTPEPIAAASLGQVYKGRLNTGEIVAVKVQRPYVLETVTVDLYIIRSMGLFLREHFPSVTERADIVALLDEWAARFFDELDYVKEGQSAERFADLFCERLPQLVVPRTYTQLTSRRVLTSEWIEGEKLSQSENGDVGTLVNIGVICYLQQLLEFGFFHSDPHPGNLIRTPDGRLAILDFGLMCEVDDDIKYGMIEAISHLIHRDYEAIVKDFVTLQFIPPGTDLQPILPVLAKVFDQALEGGGAKNINFQELAADLAQITFDYPFRIPPYFALIIRAISVLEGIALVGNPDFALVDEAFPYIAKRLLTDESPRLRDALRYMVYGKSNVFDADRLIDLLTALEDYTEASQSARGDMDKEGGVEIGGLDARARLGRGGAFTSTMPDGGDASTSGRAPLPLFPPFPFPFPFPLPGGGGANGGFGGGGFPQSVPSFMRQVWELSPMNQMLKFAQAGAMPSAAAPMPMAARGASAGNTREALRFILSPQGTWFREFVMDELVKSVDALSRDQLFLLVTSLGLQNVMVPVLLPGSTRSTLPLAPIVTDEDRKVVMNMTKIVNFLTRGQNLGDAAGNGVSTRDQFEQQQAFFSELLPVLPTVATEVVPQIAQRLASRIGARLVRELFSPAAR